jgi:hypothetical protein
MAGNDVCMASVDRIDYFGAARADNIEIRDQ